MKNIAISLENVGKKYQLNNEKRTLVKSLLMPRKKPKGTWALKNINLDIKKGETVGIIGKNGSGKSTLLKIISEITSPTTGSVQVSGRVGSLIELGAGFHQDLTGKENVFLSGTLMGFTRKELANKYNEIVNFADIGHYINEPVRTYSSGMEVRLGFSVAAHFDPQILLVDEALAVGDSAFQKKCMDKMNDFINKKDNALLYVSHNLTAIRALCKKVILLEKGKLKAVGTTNSILEKYKSDSKKNKTVRIWKNKKNAPQNDSAIITKIILTDLNGEPINKFYTNKAFNVEIEFETKKNEVSVGTTLIIYDDENNCILSSISNLETNWFDKKMPKGKYSSKILIPANLLNNGLINLSINLFSHNYSDSLMISNVINLQINDSQDLRGTYYGEFKGVIRPRFTWKTIKK